MKIERKCKICEKKFVAIKHTQYFCCRKCFKKDYYQRTKERLAILSKKHPSYNCPVCANGTELPFDPTKNSGDFNALVCPFCGIPKSVVSYFWTNANFTLGNSMTAQFVIHSAIVSTSL